MRGGCRASLELLPELTLGTPPKKSQNRPNPSLRSPLQLRFQHLRSTGRDRRRRAALRAGRPRCCSRPYHNMMHDLHRRHGHGDSHRSSVQRRLQDGKLERCRDAAFLRFATILLTRYHSFIRTLRSKPRSSEVTGADFCCHCLQPLHLSHPPVLVSSNGRLDLRKPMP